MEEASGRLTEAFRRFDEIHAEDPKRISQDRMEVPWSLHYHRRMTHWLDRLEPGASEALRLAARCQHIRRWTVPRAGYPAGKLGYKKWRSDYVRLHFFSARQRILPVQPSKSNT